LRDHGGGLTFGYAIGQTASRGEIKAITPGQFSAFTINKSLTVTGVDGDDPALRRRRRDRGLGRSGRCRQHLR
jgi:hypothetical protein